MFTRARSFLLLACTMLAALCALAPAPSVHAAETRPVARCSAAHVAQLKATAAAKARKIKGTSKKAAARRRAARAASLAQGLRRAGCTAKAVTTTVTTISTAKTGTRAPAAASTDAQTPVTAPSRIAPAPQTGQSWWTGIQGGANDWDARVGQAVGARIVRVEFAIGTPAAALRATIADYADHGIRVLPLAGFAGRVATAAEARNLAGWAREFGPGGSFWAGRPDGQLAIRHIEFGNETSYAYQGTQRTGGEYAQRVRDAAQAIAATGAQVGLLVQADNANQSDDWVGQMYAAVPNLHDYVAGWTVHPYGPRGRWQNRLDDVIAETARRGAPTTIPVDITEWGLATDDGRCLDDNYGWDRCMTFGQAAEALTSTVADMKARYGGRIRHFLIYNGRDLRAPGQTGDREHYFGLQTLTENDKGAYTAAARTLLAS